MRQGDIATQLSRERRWRGRVQFSPSNANLNRHRHACSGTAYTWCARCCQRI